MIFCSRGHFDLLIQATNLSLYGLQLSKVLLSKAAFNDFWIYFAFKDVNTLYSLYYFAFKVTNVYLTPPNWTNRQITVFLKRYASTAYPLNGGYRYPKTGHPKILGNLQYSHP